jgi:hypothetical protein
VADEWFDGLSWVRVFEAPARAVLPALRETAYLGLTDLGLLSDCDPMTRVVVACGTAPAGAASWRGNSTFRLVVAPAVHPGKATRSAVEATQPLPERARVRRVPPSAEAVR